VTDSRSAATAARTAAALDSSTSNGGGGISPPPLFRFTQLKAVTSSGAVMSVSRDFVFSKPESAAAWRPNLALAIRGAETAAAVDRNTTSSAAGVKINNGHGQFSSGSSSGSLSGSCIGSTAFSLGTNGGGGGPLLNFKSAAMPDVTNNAKLTKGVHQMQGVLKNSSNSLLPDLTASTTFSFGAARQLKTGSVMDILGKKA